jgi:exodeoxyribonuclease VIII
MTPPFDFNPFDLDFEDEAEVVELIGFDDDEIFTGPGIYFELSNEAYHSGPGISKSGLDMIAANPSSYLWSKAAPTLPNALQALDMGTALHCALLEPLEFEKRFIVAPAFNRRTTQGKADEAAFLAEVANEGKTILENEDAAKLVIMKESVMAHPVARLVFESEGHNEASIYWNDSETGELCRIRPDRMPVINNQKIIVDVKKVADMSRLERHIEDFRYHVQQAMYLDGYKAHFGESTEFWFLCVSSTVNCGRFEVDVVDLPAEWVQTGHDLYRQNLRTYHECKTNDDWLHVRTLNRPRWA